MRPLTCSNVAPVPGPYATSNCSHAFWVGFLRRVALCSGLTPSSFTSIAGETAPSALAFAAAIAAIGGALSPPIEAAVGCGEGCALPSPPLRVATESEEPIATKGELDIGRLPPLMVLKVEAGDMCGNPPIIDCAKEPIIDSIAVSWGADDTGALSTVSIEGGVVTAVGAGRAVSASGRTPPTSRLSPKRRATLLTKPTVLKSSEVLIAAGFSSSSK